MDHVTGKPPAPQADRDAWAEPGVEELGGGVYRIPLPLPGDALRAVNIYAITGDEGEELRTGDPNEDCTPDDRPDLDPRSRRKPRKLLLRTDLLTAETEALYASICGVIVLRTARIGASFRKPQTAA